MSTLKARLAAMSKEDRDAELIKLWQQFAGTPYLELFCWAVDDVREELLNAAMSPGIVDSGRTHACGGINALNHLVRYVRSAVNFNAAEAVTSPESFETDASDSFTPSSE